MTKVNSILEHVRQQIKYHRKNTLWGHFITILNFNSNGYSGVVKKKDFRIWRYNYWIGVFYPVIVGTLNKTEGKLMVRLKSEMNPVGIIFFIIIMTSWSYGVFVGVFNQFDNSWEFLWIRILIGLFLFSLPLIAIFLGYNSEKKQLLKEIRNICLLTNIS